MTFGIMGILNRQRGQLKVHQMDMFILSESQDPVIPSQPLLPPPLFYREEW